MVVFDLKRAREDDGSEVKDERVVKRRRSSNELLAIDPEGSRTSETEPRSRSQSHQDPEKRGLGADTGIDAETSSESEDVSSSDELSQSSSQQTSSHDSDMTSDGPHDWPGLSTGEVSTSGDEESINSDEASVVSDEDDSSSSDSSESLLHATEPHGDISTIPKSLPSSKPSISKPTGAQDLQSRLSSFLPAMQEANARLLDPEEISERRLDDVKVGEEHYIEMDLGLGVLKEKRFTNGEGEGEGEGEVKVQDSSSEDGGGGGGDSSDGENGGRDRGEESGVSLLAKLKGEVGKREEKPGIEEISPS